MYNSMELLQLTVEGNCEICKQRIETAAMEVSGVLSASWDVRTSKLLLTIESRRTSLDIISKAIAKAGHNTEKHKVEEKIHILLPDCCKSVSKMTVFRPNNKMPHNI